MEFITPKGTVVKFKEYITGRDYNAYKNVMYKNMAVDNASGEARPVFNMNAVLEQEMKALQLTVLEVGGVAQNPAELVLDLEKTEYEAVINFMNNTFFLMESEKKS